MRVDPRLPTTRPSWTLYAGWLAIALFYCYQYMLRVSLGVLVTPLRGTFHLTADQFASLGSAYLYAYAAFQIPVGIWIDRYGNRQIILGSMALCVGAGFLFAYASTIEMLQMSRVLMGAGSASAFMCALKAVMDDIPRSQHGLCMGATLMLGTLGALVAGEPVVLLSEAWGWRGAMALISCLGVVLWIFSYRLIPTVSPVAPPIRQREPQPRFRMLFPWMAWFRIGVYAILAIALYAPLSVLADLWGVAFFMERYGISRLDAAQSAMMAYAGLGIGCLLWPWWAERYMACNRMIAGSLTGLVVTFALLLYSPVPAWSLGLIMAGIGFWCGSEMLCFMGATQGVVAHRVGLVLGMVNTLNMAGGGLLQQLMGWVLESYWKQAGQPLDSQALRIYTAASYTDALSILVGVIFLCALIAWFLPRDRDPASQE